MAPRGPTDGKPSAGRFFMGATMSFGISSNADTFDEALGGVSDAVLQQKLDLWMQLKMFEIMEAIIEETPVDTGRARGGWTAVEKLSGVGRIDVGGSNPEAVEEGRDRSELKEELGGVTKAIEVTNAVEYITLLEFGRSDQAPDGMVRTTLRKFASASRFLEDLGGDIEQAYMG